jgi:hypothetical protein
VTIVLIERSAADPSARTEVTPTPATASVVRVSAANAFAIAWKAVAARRRHAGALR